MTLKTVAGMACFVGLSFTTAASAASFTITSEDMAAGEPMSKEQEFKGFGCDGDNLSPQLSWHDAPAGTNFYALFVYDPDAPTGSGWWHWQVVNIPASTTELPTGAGSAGSMVLPEGSMQIVNDFGYAGFGGACPPEGHKAHRYQFTVFALPEKLSLPDNPSGALTGYMVNMNALGKATLEVTYQR
ncbi:YbhB/YbcL family Raf kinase inhibitor-like protein [Alteromonas sp. 1_MG-2023]|uniref:YbhB/YbcL family Raf kinase inhibitor-like protein n=1 Tax=Alteromonas sp. 1_MG-2023 TaxID=3062669 RepID=UPI0026E14E0A|nr:YbhB/YbcL family Raf kinase inhibitor-like protein [Alteromonas sp. 1_MG-2023]MDO6476126.1 YbhB/YbcL family Raf kinase inhibitor-like protein [Alteromonas sp. 1_MG-2023]